MSKVNTLRLMIVAIILVGGLVVFTLDNYTNLLSPLSYLFGFAIGFIVGITWIRLQDEKRSQKGGKP